MVNPQLGAAYLGTQGDIWDAQKDMLAAIIGAILAMLITFYKVRTPKNLNKTANNVSGK